ncbi:hypothetical protein BGX38DRAFT_1273807 [Terfezia claveryi]|nr:hypothetical protein BGX38DRAFT_1273807 [Terfezia claveryi]
MFDAEFTTIVEYGLSYNHQPNFGHSLWRRMILIHFKTTLMTGKAYAFLIEVCLTGWAGCGRPLEGELTVVTLFASILNCVALFYGGALYADALILHNSACQSFFLYLGGPEDCGLEPAQVSGWGTTVKISTMHTPTGGSADAEQAWRPWQSWVATQDTSPRMEESSGVA